MGSIVQWPEGVSREELTVPYRNGHPTDLLMWQAIREGMDLDEIIRLLDMIHGF